jgi:hypothetical protein
MRRLIQLIVLSTMLAAFALPALAQDTAAAQTGPQDESAAKTELYKKFTAAYNRGKEIKKADPNLAQPGNKEAYNQAAKEAYDFAKEYVQKYPVVNPDPNKPDAIFNFQKNYIDAYDKAVKEERKLQLGQLIKDKKFSETFTLGRQILAEEPNDLGTNYDLARAGLTAALNNPPDESNNAETAKAARKAIQLIESGATFEPGKPIAKKDEVLALMHYALGVSVRKEAPGDAVNAFIKVGHLEGPLKSDPWPYYLLAVAYQAKEYEALAKDFQARCTTQEQRDGADCKALTDRINLVVDRVIDAYARAIAYSGTNPLYQTAKGEWTKQLTDFYKYRHDGKEDGLTAYIAGIKNQPLPGPLPAANATPAPTSSSTPATSGSAMTTTPAVSTSPAPQATPVSATTNTTTTAKPATTATTTPKTTTTAPKTTPKTTPKKKAHASRH